MKPILSSNISGLILASTLNFGAVAAETRSELLHSGYAYLMRGCHLQAIADFSQVVRMDPADCTARRYLAEALRQAGKLDEAIINLEILISAKPHDSELKISLAETAFLSGKSQEAQRYFRSALQNEPENIRARIGLVKCLMSRDLCREARVACLEGLPKVKDRQAEKQLKTLLAEIEERLSTKRVFSGAG